MLENNVIIEAQVEESTDVNLETTLPLANFVRDFGEGLLQAVSEQNPPVYDGQPNPKRKWVMENLLRKPFEAQQKAVQAVCHLLLNENERAAIINAEMGTGKSMMGIATAAILHQEGLPRTLILSPPHLVYKWRREIISTVPHAKVWILNGPDTLQKLLQLRDLVKENACVTEPEFFIMGRVRLRMGYHWQPAFIKRLRHERKQTDVMDECSLSFVMTTAYAACPACGEIVRDVEGKGILAERFPTDKTYACQNKKCGQPLWTLIRPKQLFSQKETVHKALCQIPTLGTKRAEKLISQFGEDFLANALSDNVYQFINLMDEKGNMVFSDNQARRMEKVLAKAEFSFGQGGYQATEFIKRYLPDNFFSLLLVDECHEYKAMGSAQGQAMGVLASKVKKIVLLTGTLMGGYADDLFYLFWRVMPHKLLEDGFGYSQRGSLASAALAFMDQHGVLKRIHRTKEADNYRTARGKRQTVNTSKAPGFGPKGIVRYVLPYTVFLKLPDIGQAILPPYQEHFIEVSMQETQAMYYERLEGTLLAELKSALRKGDRTLLGVIMNCLLAWPDCCFRDEFVKHPRTKNLLYSAPAVLEEDASPKEMEMINLCKLARQKGQRTLVYTTYTGTRDTASRLKTLLEKAGFKAAVLRSTVETDKREDWIDEQVDKGIDIIICNPELVKTGLDLLEFPTIVFMQSGFNVYTLMQAARRSWRIGQKLPVNVYFLGYSGTAQIKCLELMAKKITVSQSTSGTMPETGLDILSQDGDSVEVALAKQLVR